MRLPTSLFLHTMQALLSTRPRSLQLLAMFSPSPLPFVLPPPLWVPVSAPPPETMNSKPTAVESYQRLVVVASSPMVTAR